jgi:hypothetical protein
MIYFIASFATAYAGYGLEVPQSSFSQGAWIQPTQFQPTVSSFSQGSLDQSEFKPIKLQTYTPDVSSFSQGSWVQPTQFEQKLQTYTPEVSSFSQESWVQPTQFQPMAEMKLQTYTPEVSSFSQGAWAQPTEFQPMAEEMSNPQLTNPYQAEVLKNMPSQVVVSRQKSAGMPIDTQYIGEEHVIHNDLKVHENHATDKTILTKKVIHHAPVLHKTIRTHEIAEDTVHDKLIHHLNTVEDQWKRVPGQSYVGAQKTVDHTEAIAPAPMFKASKIPETVRVAPHNA